MKDVIIVTGGLGFIGSNLIKHLNTLGYDNIIIIDNPKDNFKIRNINNLKFLDFFDYKCNIIKTIDNIKESYDISFIFHLGANADVLETDASKIFHSNVTHSKYWLHTANQLNIPFVYASSSAVYGNSKSFIPDIDTDIQPLNLYGFTKATFDKYVWVNKSTWKNTVIGLRFFNVFGEGEYHKGKNASIPYRFYESIKNSIFQSPKIELFKTEPIIKRDYIYVQDLVKILTSILTGKFESGLYNIGGGNPVGHDEVAEIVIQCFVDNNILNDPNHNNINYIKYIDVPNTLRNTLQYYTEAQDMKSYFKHMIGDNKEQIKAYINNLIKNK